MKAKLLAAVAVLALGAVAAHAEDAAPSKTTAAAPAKPPKKKVVVKKKSAVVVAAPVYKSEPVAAPAPENLFSAVLNGDPLEYKGIRLYGALDFGGGWQSHSAPFNGAFPQGVEYAISKNSNKAGFVAAPGGMGYNNIGLKGDEKLFSTEPTGDVKLVFDMNSSFDPYSLQLSNGGKSLLQNNGTTSAALGASSSNGDSARNGQIFNDFAYAGLSSSTLGTLTFGRQRLFSVDDFKAFDPFAGALAFSLLGYSSALNGGATEATRLNQSLKYVYELGAYHAGALVQLGQYANGEKGGRGSYQFQVGANWSDFSTSADWGHTSGATTLNYYSNANWIGSNKLAIYLSDEDQFLIGAKYKYSAFTFFGGYEWFRVSNPTATVANGSAFSNPDGFQGYAYSNVYVTPKNEQLFWGGLKYAYDAKIDLIASYTHLLQNAYSANSYTKISAAGKAATYTAACNTTAASNCSGTENALSFAIDYHHTRNLELYAGVMYTVVSNGLASGFLNKTEWDPTIGLRYSF